MWKDASTRHLFPRAFVRALIPSHRVAHRESYKLSSIRSKLDQAFHASAR